GARGQAGQRPQRLQRRALVRPARPAAPRRPPAIHAAATGSYRQRSRAEPPSGAPAPRPGRAGRPQPRPFPAFRPRKQDGAPQPPRLFAHAARRARDNRQHPGPRALASARLPFSGTTRHRQPTLTTTQTDPPTPPPPPPPPAPPTP